MAWFNTSTSSIQPWLEFNGTLPVLRPCEVALFPSNSTGPLWQETSCANVCNDTFSLFFTPHSSNQNLAQCGIWLSLMADHTYFRRGGADNPTGAIDSAPGHLAYLDWEGIPDSYLNFSSYELAQSTSYTIAFTLQWLYWSLRAFSSDDAGLVPASCTTRSLFPIGAVGNRLDGRNVTKSMKGCLKEICDPITLDPDLAGIGVFLSFLIQSGVALVAFVILTTRKQLFSHREKKYSDRLVSALMDFHKSQCYFASIIQITALILFSQRQNVGHEAGGPGSTYQLNFIGDVSDASVLQALATTGFLPITLTLVCIARHGRLSWYPLAFSLNAVLLATATLVCSFLCTQQQGQFTESMHGPPSTQLIDDFAIATALCGSSRLRTNYVHVASKASPWVWLMWTICISSLGYCFGRKLNQYDRFQQLMEKPTRRWRGFIQQFPFKKATMSSLWRWLFTGVWSACFAGQFVLFSLYFRHSLISYTWSFGQIISITVWIPALSEFVYVEIRGIEEASKYRYPPPFRAMKYLVRESFAVTGFTSPRFLDPEEKGGYVPVAKAKPVVAASTSTREREVSPSEDYRASSTGSPTVAGGGGGGRHRDPEEIGVVTVYPGT